MKIGYLLIVLFLGYVAWKYAGFKKTVVGKARPVKQQNRPGVSLYCNRAAPNRPAQLQAFARRNSMQTTQAGFAPALGANENQPQNIPYITV